MPFLHSSLTADRSMIKVKPFLAALTIVFFADSIMSYAFPIWVEQAVGSTTMLGVIMALSSVFGISCDLIFPQFLKIKHWRMQLLVTICIALLFPIATYLGMAWGSALILVLASISWGVYYELLYFAEGNFIADTVERSQLSRTWALVTFIGGITKVISPILAALLVETPLQLVAVVILFHLIGVVPMFFIKPKKQLADVDQPPSQGDDQPAAQRPTVMSFNLLHELKSWRILLPTMYPVVMTGILIGAVDAAFWTLGALFGEELFTKQNIHIGDLVLDHHFAWLPLFLYLIPSLFGSLLLLKAGIVEHKKRYSEILVVLTGLCLLMNLFIPWSIWSLLPFLLVGLLINWAFPLNSAVYSDLIKRAHGFQEDIVGLSQANYSIAYILVPLIAGFSADQWGFWNTFYGLGAILVVFGGLLLIITPRKIRLPQTAMVEQLH